MTAGAPRSAEEEAAAAAAGRLLLPREFFGRTALDVAPALLGCVLEHETPDGLVAVALTEVEAYEGAADPASHAYRGRTARNAVMFGRPGHAYVYFTYGMHFCVNLVCLPEGTASAVLLRAGRVVEGVGLATARRTAGRRLAAATRAGPGERDLARGPARLCQALGVGRPLDGADVCDPASPLRIRMTNEPQFRNDPRLGSDPGRAAGSPAGPDPRISTGPRVGVSTATRRPWRFWLAGDPSVSPYRAHARRARSKAVSPPDGRDGTMHR